MEGQREQREWPGLDVHLQLILMIGDDLSELLLDCPWSERASHASQEATHHTQSPVAVHEGLQAT